MVTLGMSAWVALGTWLLLLQSPIPSCCVLFPSLPPDDPDQPDTLPSCQSGDTIGTALYDTSDGSEVGEFAGFHVCCLDEETGEPLCSASVPVEDFDEEEAEQQSHQVQQTDITNISSILDFMEDVFAVTDGVMSPPIPSTISVTTPLKIEPQTISTPSQTEPETTAPLPRTPKFPGKSDLTQGKYQEAIYRHSGEFVPNANDWRDANGMFKPGPVKILLQLLADL